MQTPFIWASEAPGDAVKSLYSMRTSTSSLSPYREQLNPGWISLGFVESAKRPAIALIDEGRSMEVLGWVATYASEAFPLTQTVRVLGVNEFDNYAETRWRISDEHARVWSSLILGEMLSQGAGASDAEKVPVLRAMACFTYSVARASLLSGREEGVLRRTVERLHVLERDSLFSGRPLRVSDLRHLWQLADEISWERNDLARALRAIVEIAKGRPVGAASDLPELSSLGIDASKLSTGGIEQRVTEFERATACVVEQSTRNNWSSDKTPMYLAAFAFWVGGGTTHIGLLEEFSQTYPAVYSWMGLFAGVSGADCWDKRWLRATTSVERIVRMPFTLSDPPNADLCWSEYDFISAQRLPGEWIKDITKLSPKTLTVEVSPGATCQMRLSEISLDAEEKPVVLTTQRKTLQESDLSKLKEITEFMQAFLHRQGSTQSGQPGLFGDLVSPQRTNAIQAPSKKRGAAKKTKY